MHSFCFYPCSTIPCSCSTIYPHTLQCYSHPLVFASHLFIVLTGTIFLEESGWEKCRRRGASFAEKVAVMNLVAPVTTDNTLLPR